MKLTTEIRAAAMMPVVAAMMGVGVGAETRVGLLGIDGNGNGLSDVFEAMYPGAGGPMDDPDGDGLRNADEAAWGSGPFERDEATRVVLEDNGVGMMTAKWATVTGKDYQLESAVDAAGEWAAEGGVVRGNGGEQMVALGPVEGRRFFRVRVRDRDGDQDGVTDWEELMAGTDPELWDSDGDGRGDFGRVSAKCGERSVVSVVATSTWATEYGRRGEWTIVRRGGIGPVVVRFALGGTAVLGSDYAVSAGGQVEIPAGKSEAVVTLEALGDAVLEEAETVVLTLAEGRGYDVAGAGAAAVTIVSQGIVGQYFDGASGTYAFGDTAGNFNPAQLRLTRRDAGISFDWGSGPPPAPLVDDDVFSVRWRGFVIPKYNEVYTIHAVADRGVKVYVSPVPVTGAAGQIRIDQWSTASPATKFSNNMISSTAVTDGVAGSTAVAGRPYHVVVDYRDSAGVPGSANVELRWSSASQPEEVIPVSAWTGEGFIGKAPVISGPLVAAAVAGAPFVWQVGASNLPTVYGATGLPAGLAIDAASGRISGTVAGGEGYYEATVTAANAGGADVAVLTIYVTTTGGRMSYEVWNGVSGAVEEGVGPVPVASVPTLKSEVTAMEAPGGGGDFMGDRMHGFVTAPMSGNYVFYVSSDENAELWISSSAEPGRRLKRAWVVNGNVQGGVWDAVASQVSLPMAMRAGERYYVEAIRRETTGGGHFRVGWRKPGDTVPEVIPAYALSPYGGAVAGVTEGTVYVAQLTPQNGAATLGSGSAVLRVNAAKTEAELTFTHTNLTGAVISQHIHDARPVPGPSGGIVFDIDEAEPDSKGVRVWEIAGTGQHTVADVVAAIESGQAYLNLHTSLYPAGEVKGFFQPVAGSQFFVPPADAGSAELTLPAAGVARREAVVRFLQQATFGARHDTDGVAPWDADSIEAVEELGYAGWIDAQVAMGRGPDPEVVVTQVLPPRVVYREPTAALRTLRGNANVTGYNGSGPLAGHVARHYERFPLSDVGTVGTPLESSAEIWRAWWRAACTARDQLRHRVAFALSEMLVVSEDGELDEQARALVHFHDLLYWHGLGNYRTLLERVTLNPSMGRYLDMLNNKKPNAATGYIPNENFAREILQLFSVGLRRLHPDGTMVVDAGGLPLNTYEQPNVVGFAHVFTGWVLPGTTSDYVSPMVVRATDHATGQKLLLENAVIPAVGTATTAGCQAELAAALDVIFHHPNTGPFVSRQLIQRMVTANPSPGYVWRVAKVFANNGKGERGDLGAVVKAILLDPEARNGAMRTQVGYGHLKEPVIRATQMLRAFRGFSHGETNLGGVRVLGAVVVSPSGPVDLGVPLPVTGYTLVGTTALFPGNVVTLTNQNPASDNGTWIFAGNGQPLSRWTSVDPPAGAGTAVTLGTDVADVSQPLTVTNAVVVEGIPLSSGNRVLLRVQTNPAENGVYVFNGAGQLLTRWSGADEAVELNGSAVTVSAWRDPVTQLYSNRTFVVSGVVAEVGVSPVTYVDGSATNAGRRAWEMGTTGGGSFEQTPLRSPTVFNFFEPDHAFAGESGGAGLVSPEFQITSETSVVNTANWFYELTRRNNTNAATQGAPFTYGQGFAYGDPVKKDVKLDVTAELALAGNAGALVDRIGLLLMPGQMTPALRSLLVNYLNGLPAATAADRMTRVCEALYLVAIAPECAHQN
jgi:hypothetical protein